MRRNRTDPMHVSRDLAILLAFMGVTFFVGYAVAEARSGNMEIAAISAGVSSAAGMALGYAFLAIEKRWNTKHEPRFAYRRDFSPQLVGETCQKCGQRVIFVAEAFYCSECGKPYHRRCGQPPRCQECAAKVAAANRAILVDLDYDFESQEWIPTTHESQ